MPHQLWMLLLVISSQARSSSQAEPSPIRSALALKLSHYNDLIYYDFVLFRSSDVMSLVECARACFENNRCVLFTWKWEKRSVGRCVGYYSFVATTSAVSWPHTKTFIFMERAHASNAISSEWLYKSCKSNDDCLSQYCYAGRCMCLPYTHYSITQDACIDSCPQEDLQRDVFLTYPVPITRALGYVDSNKTRTNQECMNVCSQLSYCTACEFDVAGFCYMYSTPACDCYSAYSVKEEETYAYNRMVCR
ncbi:hypothetical protein V1264_024672 [Littorina saxatilis]|uniref:Apple domain-containing protein n=1 Tax=Littorina saxatilis TaxID=31220 RepID=A0AAN9FZI9_9CAEN